MANTFAAIDVGSYELAMKIYETSKKGGLKEIDHIRQRIDLGSDTYASGKISFRNMEQLCRGLREFTRIMKTYDVKEYTAYGTSAVRETRNTAVVLDQIRQRTSLTVGVLSNSEQRFLDYKAVALKTPDFEKLIEEGVAIVDIGGGSMQISLFREGKLTATKNLALGILRIAEELRKIKPRTVQVPELLKEIISNELTLFSNLYLEGAKYRHVIVVDDYVSQIMHARARFYGNNAAGEIGRFSISEFTLFRQEIGRRTDEEIAGQLGIPEENAPLLTVAAAIVSEVVELFGSAEIHTPGVTLCDGIAYEKAQRDKLIATYHDFDADILSAADHIAGRYLSGGARSAAVEDYALKIFDSMKKIHGLSDRERLLLRIAVRLHDIGKYISLIRVGTGGYSIIMGSEIIGLSHQEREIVAEAVRYTYEEFEYGLALDNMNSSPHYRRLIIAKLTAILRVARALDRGHKKKYEDIKVALKEDALQIHISSDEDITLERSAIGECSDFFEEIYSYKPTIRLHSR